MVAELLKIAPDNPKLNLYVVNVYLAYGYPDLAFEYYEKRRDLLKGRAVSALSTMLNDALERGDEKRALFLLGEIEAHFKRPGHMPYETSSLQFYRIRYLRYLIKNGRNGEAAKRASSWLEDFLRDVEKERDNPFWKNKRYSEEQRKRMKRYYFDLSFPYAALQLLELRNTALAAAGSDEDLYAPLFERMKPILAMLDDDNYGVTALYYLFRAYNSLAAVAKAKGDKEKEAAFRKKGRECYDRYRKIIEENRKKREEAAKKAAAKKKESGAKEDEKSSAK